MESTWLLGSAFFNGNEFEDTREDNRTLLPIGATTSPDNGGGLNFDLLRCAASHTGSGTMRPTVTWLRDGVELVVDGGGKVVITAIVDGASGTASILTVTDFQLLDTGIYQCVFTNPTGSQEVITSSPFRLDAGMYVDLYSYNNHSLWQEHWNV